MSNEMIGVDSRGSMADMTVGSTPVTRVASAARTRDAIVCAARTLFGTDGIAATSLASVALQARITRAGVLRHFSHIDSLLEEVASRFQDEVHALLVGAQGNASWHCVTADYSVMSAQMLSVALTRRTVLTPVTGHHRGLLHFGPPATDSDHYRLLPVQCQRAVVAAWEGLQIMSCYFRELDPAYVFAAKLHGPELQMTSADPLIADPVPFESLLTAETGYAPGRRRREQIIVDATALFARQGFHGTTVRELAAAVGVSPSTLLHYVGDKKQLLAEVLRQRDQAMVRRRGGAVLDPVTEMAQLGAEARRDLAVEPGLIGLYGVMSTEATTPGHPAHLYFKERYARAITYVENVIQRASQTLRVRTNPRIEATWLVAMWDGLQYQHLLEQGTVDLPSILDAHIDELFNHHDAISTAREAGAYA